MHNIATAVRKAAERENNMRHGKNMFLILFVYGYDVYRVKMNKFSENMDSIRSMASRIGKQSKDFIIFHVKIKTFIAISGSNYSNLFRSLWLF